VTNPVPIGAGSPRLRADRQLQLALKQLQSASQSLSKTAASSATQANLAPIYAQLAAFATEIANLIAEVASLMPSTFTAGQTIAKYQVVYERTTGTAAVADNTSAPTAILGFALNAASVGQSVSVAQDGDTVTNPTWSFTPMGAVYLSSTGSVTQTKPSSGSVVPLGYAVGTNSVLVLIQPPQSTASGGVFDTSFAFFTG
jgi:hypothetical protein